MDLYSIEFTRPAIADLSTFRKFDRVRIVEMIEKHLVSAPLAESSHIIKKLNPPLLAQFRLAVGEHRVFYEVDEVQHRVIVVAVRYKGRQTLEEAAHGQNP